ncbi:MAG: LysM domain-containing protein [Aliishimia sp.]
MSQENGRLRRVDSQGDVPKSNLPLLLIATAFLTLTIVLILLQSDENTHVASRVPTTASSPQPEVVAQTTASIPTPSIPEPSSAAEPLNGPLAAALRADNAPVEELEPQYDVVARAQMPLLSVSFTPIDRVTSAAITEQLRQPIRLINIGVPKRDLPTLTDDVLTLLSPKNAQSSQGMQDLLTDAVTQRQSDAYIRVLLNTAAERGQFEVPPTLRTTTGTFDAYSLLKAMAQTAGSPVPKMPKRVETNGTQKIVPGDSLARLALRYYGQPLKYDIILAANPQIDPRNPILTPGDVIQMPKP